MGKKVLAYKEKTVKVPTGFQYSCDTCGYIFSKGERKVTYYSDGKKYACNDKPCSPFSNPTSYEYIWDTSKRCYVWRELAHTKLPQSSKEK